MKWRNRKTILRTASFIICLAMVLSLCGCCLSHDGKDATCVDPRRCTKCGKTDGEPLGHMWEPATCSHPKTCERCGKTEGAALPHTEGGWTVVTEPSLSWPGEEKISCSVCGQVLQSRTVTKSIEYKSGSYNFTKEEFMSYLESRTNQGYAFRDGEKNLDFYGYPYVVYDDKGTLVTVISFEENASKAVTAIYVWGMNVSCVPFAIHVFQLVIGEDIDLTSVLNGFERTNMYKKNGYIIEYSEPETDVFCFEVKGL